MAHLFKPLTLRAVTIPNRVVVSPMSQYRAVNGIANDWHFAHLSRFALGGAGLVFTEATAVTESGRRTPGDLGLWNDAQIEPLRRITQFIKANGAIPGIQISHAGRKASERRPWHGNQCLDQEDVTERGEHPWETIGPTDEPFGPNWHAPKAMTETIIRDVLDAFSATARRAVEAGFEVIDLYGGHGFLMHQFLSPACNTRTDAYGGTAENRQRFGLEVIDAVRREWPEQFPLFYRISAVDWADGGLHIEEATAFAMQAYARGVDVMDVSTGGIGGPAKRQNIPIGPAFQASYAGEIRKETGRHTMAVGFIRTAEEAERVLQSEQADLVAIAREILYDPNWALHAAQALGVDEEFSLWQPEFGWWLKGRERALKKLQLPGTFFSGTASTIVDLSEQKKG